MAAERDEPAGPPAPGLVPAAPRSGPGVCAVCRGPARPGFGWCWCCRELERQLGPLAPVAPVGACPVPGPFLAVLRHYKDGGSEAERRRAAGMLAGVLARFMATSAADLDRLAGGPLDRAVVVPPTGRPTAPLEGVVGAAWSAVPGPPLVPGALVLEPVPGGRAGSGRGCGRCRRRPVSVVPGVAGAVAGGRILLLDDTLTTGATAQSAAAGLRAAGARSVVVVVLGRVVRPGLAPSHAGYWDRVVTGLRTRPPPGPARSGRR